jgi:hypothetical protein
VSEVVGHYPFLLPVAFVGVIAITTYLPSAFLSTNYNFVYASCANGNNIDYYPQSCNRYLQNLYSVVDGKLL